MLIAAGVGLADFAPIYLSQAKDLRALGRRAEAAEAARRVYLDGGPDYDEPRAEFEA